MIDEGLTDVLRRRIIASLIDLGVVGGLTLLFARSQSERFAILDRDGEGRAVFSQADADRVEAIAREFNRTQEIGDTLYAFKAIDVLFVLVVGALLTLLAKVLIPANTGWSLGQKIMGLRVINDELGHPTTSQHLRRTMGGIVDFFPYVIPGLVGWVMARSKPFKRRFGDTLADTAVISTRTEVDAPSAPTTATATTAASAADDVDVDSTADAAAVDLPPPPEPASSPSPPPPNGDPIRDDEAVPTADLDTAAASAAVASPAGPVSLVPEAVQPPADLDSAVAAATVDDSPASRLQQASQRNDGLTPAQPFEPEIASPAADDVPEIDLTEPASPLGAALARAVDPTPTPADPAPAESLPTDAAAADTPVADEPLIQPRTSAFPTVAARADRPMPSHRTDEERQQLFKATNAPIDLTPSADEAPKKKLPPPPRHRAVRSDWERPIAEAAPVWGPDNLAAIEDPAPSDTAAQSLPTEALQTEPSPVESEPTPVETVAVEPEQKEPQWSDEWDSWLYWDAAHNAWLRHDTESGRWVPIT